MDESAAVNSLVRTQDGRGTVSIELSTSERGVVIGKDNGVVALQN